MGDAKAAAIHPPHRLGGRLHLRLLQLGLVVNDLPVQVAQLHVVKVHNTQPPCNTMSHQKRRTN